MSFMSLAASELKSSISCVCACDSSSISKAFASPRSHVCLLAPPPPPTTLPLHWLWMTFHVLSRCRCSTRLATGVVCTRLATVVLTNHSLCLCMCVLRYCRANVHIVIIDPCAAFYWLAVALIHKRQKSDELQRD